MSNRTRTEMPDWALLVGAALIPLGGMLIAALIAVIR